MSDLRSDLSANDVNTIVNKLGASGTYEETTGGNNEEGYSYTYHTFKLEDGVVTYDIDTQSRDCDGRMDRSISLEWTVNDGRNERGYPKWTEVGSTQRDHQAEAAGY